MVKTCYIICREKEKQCGQEHNMKKLADKGYGLTRKTGIGLAFKIMDKGGQKNLFRGKRWMGVV